VELFTARGAGHGFFNNPPWFEPTEKRMEEFFVKYLRPGPEQGAAIARLTSEPGRYQ
jgi:hypothetical protein